MDQQIAARPAALHQKYVKSFTPNLIPYFGHSTHPCPNFYGVKVGNLASIFDKSPLTRSQHILKIEMCHGSADYCHVYLPNLA